MVRNSFIWFIFAVVLVTVIAFWVTWDRWDWLRSDGQEVETNAETIRTVAIIAGGMIALVFGIWRAWETKRQSDAAHTQAEASHQQVVAAQKQVDAVRQGMLNDRFHKGAEMLGNEKLSVRLGGVYALERLADADPEEFHMQIMQQFCAFVRNPTEDPSCVSEEPAKDESRIWQDWEFDLRPDVQAIMKAIAGRSSRGIEIEQEIEFSSDFRGANLRGLALDQTTLSDLWIWKVDLSKSSFNLTRLDNVSFMDVNLSPVAFVRTEFGNTSWDCCPMQGAMFNNSVFLETGEFEGFVACDLTCADFTDADLTGITFAQSNLRGARFDSANLTGVKFSANGLNPAHNLTQSQLDVAVAEPHNPPVLTGLVDIDTGERLVWRGSTI